MTTAAQLSASRCASVTAPAGYGKTRLIAEAVAHHSDNRQLILTHTNAGVDSLLRRLAERGARRTAYSVATIAGFALRYVSAFPATSEVFLSDFDPDRTVALYQGAERALGSPYIADVIRRTYAGLYVDEYQDCTPHQHALVKGLAGLLPTRILGDPLQSLFLFEGTVDWASEVCTVFLPLPDLTTPHRWSTTNPALSEWIVRVRQAMLSDQVVELEADGATRWHRTPAQHSQVLNRICHGVLDDLASSESLVIIRKHQPQCMALARSMLGRISAIERMDAPDLLAAAQGIEGSEGSDRVRRVIKFAGQCISNVKQRFERVPDLIEGSYKPRKPPADPDTVRELAVIATDSSLAAVERGLLRLKNLPKCHVYRADLFNEMLRGLREIRRDGTLTLTEAVQRTRQRSRIVGRPVGRRIVATPRLVKGLEFDHAIVLDVNDYEREELYVALSRAARSITIVSIARTVVPREPRNT